MVTSTSLEVQKIETNLGEVAKMNLFNEVISDLDLVEIPFSGRNLTWSNMQDDPLLVKLDWVFTSASWTLSFPATFVQPLPSPHL